jgi:hypothetical protein
MMKKPVNRLFQAQPDFLLLIVRKPDGWTPRDLFDIPPICNILSVTPVASYQEAHEDLLRCNRLAEREGLEEWAVLQSLGSQL